MLTAGQEHTVTFKVNVMGTSIEPIVRLVLGGGNLVSSFSFPASKSVDSWHATIAVPEHLPPDDYDLKVEVILNNRLFTPLVKKVSVQSGDALPLPATDEVTMDVAPADVQANDEIPASVHTIVAPDERVETPPAEPTPTIALAPNKPVVRKFSFPFEEISSKTTGTKTDVKSISDHLNDKPKKTLENLQTVANKEPKKIYSPIKTPMPKPSEVQPANVQVKFGDVVKIVEMKEQNSPKKLQAKKNEAPIVEIKHEVPTTLVKGEIIFE